MNFYLAPLEGITTYTFRQVIHEYFGRGIIDKYYTPFLVPHVKRTMIDKEKNEILPENNPGISLVPQVLTDSVEDFLRFEAEMRYYGYEEININLGCPSGTVTSKGRGSGFLARTYELEKFLDGVYSHTMVRVSLKTRIGVTDPSEFEDLLEIYNKFPVYELTVHPRVKTEKYEGVPHRDIFLETLKESKNPLIYNGDIWKINDYQNLISEIEKNSSKDSKPTFGGVMMGRPLIANPALVRQIRSGERLTAGELKTFLEALKEAYRKTLKGGDLQVLYKFKELWYYMIRLFPDNEKTLKKIRKARNLQECELAVKELLSTYPDDYKY